MDLEATQRREIAAALQEDSAKFRAITVGKTANYRAFIARIWELRRNGSGEHVIRMHRMCYVHSAQSTVHYPQSTLRMHRIHRSNRGL